MGQRCKRKACSLTFTFGTAAAAIFTFDKKKFNGDEKTKMPKEISSANELNKTFFSSIFFLNERHKGAHKEGRGRERRHQQQQKKVTFFLIGFR